MRQNMDGAEHLCTTSDDLQLKIPARLLPLTGAWDSNTCSLRATAVGL